MKPDFTQTSRQRERRARRENRQRVRHRRQVILGVAAGVALLLSARFIIGRLMDPSSAVTTLAGTEHSVAVVAESSTEEATEAVTIDYLTRDELEAKTSAPRREKAQAEHFGDTLDTFLVTTTATKLYERPSTKSTEVTELSAGTYVETYGTEGDWTRVVSKGQKGYVRNRDLAVVEDPKLFKVVDGRVIVNAVYGLPETYETVFNEDAAAALRVMLEAMERDGLSVEVAATYRNAEEEKKEIVLRGNPDHAPEVGHTVFQTGYGVQFNAPNTDPRIDNEFEKTQAYAWLNAHANEYGFIERYPAGSESITGYRADPTIFTYVGVQDAAIISNEGLTMEVFYGVN
ncbi:MAG: M15 family metallopeptidase [Peptoniphilaceae bacterium]|nr:M15 family metallopeptidase [Peptoniphilaceae bacterium]MDY6086308.1 M15 family metallopeptidase [Peptoniphilaceae bacterium]